MVKCPKCGKGYVSTNRFKYKTTEDKALLVCPACIEKNERESKRLEPKTYKKPTSIARKIIAGILIFFGIIIIFASIFDIIFSGISINSSATIIGRLMLSIPMLLIDYFLFK